MNLLDSIQKYFSREQQQFYCQNCGNELTNRGGDISGSRKIYCHGDYGVETSCGMKAIWGGREVGAVILDFYDSREVQRLIRKKELKQFGLLEQVVEKG